MPAAPIPAPAPEAVPEAETVGVLPSFAADSPVPPAASAIAVPGAIPIAIPGAAPVPDRDLVGAAPPPAAFALPASSHSSIAAPNALRRSRVPLIAGAIVVLALLVTLVLTLR